MQYLGLTLVDATWTQLPPKEAIRVFKRRLYFGGVYDREAFDKLSDNLKQRSFTVAYLQHDKQLLDAGKSLTKALQEGTSRNKWVSEWRERLAADGITGSSKAHLETVFSTNVLGSYQHGRWEQMRTKPMMRLRPFWQYSTAGDNRVRPNHAGMNGKVFPADHEIWNTWYPPNGYRCRCTVLPLRKSEAEKAGISKVPQISPDKGFAGSPEANVRPLVKPPKVLPKKAPPPKPKRPTAPPAKPKRVVRPKAPPMDLDVSQVPIDEMDDKWIKRTFDYDLTKAVGDANKLTPERYREIRAGFKRAEEQLIELEKQVRDKWMLASKLRKLRPRLQAQSNALEGLEGLFDASEDARRAVANWQGDSFRRSAKIWGDDVANGLGHKKYQTAAVDGRYYSEMEKSHPYCNNFGGLHERGGPGGIDPGRYSLEPGRPTITYRDTGGPKLRTAVHEMAHGVDISLTRSGFERYFEKLPKEYVTNYARKATVEDVAETVEEFIFAKGARGLPDAPVRARLMEKLFRFKRQGLAHKEVEVNKNVLLIMRQLGEVVGYGRGRPKGLITPKKAQKLIEKLKKF
jgi:SPP1 gp7 family putative phage head morphogenesis protein